MGTILALLLAFFGTIERPCEYGCIVAPGFVYQLTRSDLLWTARMANCEVATVIGTDEAPATLWSLTQNFVRRHERGRRESFGSFVASYSGCTSRRWATGGDKYSPRITPIADWNRKLGWNEIPERVRGFMIDYFGGKYPNRWAGWCYVWTHGWEDHADRRAIGPFYAESNGGGSLNAYYKDQETASWEAGRVQIVPSWGEPTW